MPLLACTCNQPKRLAQALVPLRAALTIPPRGSGWGIAHLRGGEVHLSRTQHISREPVDFYPAVAALETDCLIGHAVSVEDDDNPTTDNLQPLRFHRWMFAQERGRILAPEPWQEITRRLPDFLRRNLLGRTTTELSLHLFLSTLHEQVALDDPNLAPSVAHLALATALAQLASELAGTALPGNVAFSNSHFLSVARLTDVPVYLQPLHILDKDGHPDDSFRGFLILSTTQPPPQGAEQLQPGTLVTISRDLRVERASLPTPV